MIGLYNALYIYICKALQSIIRLCVLVRFQHKWKTILSECSIGRLRSPCDALSFVLRATKGSLYIYIYIYIMA